VPRIDFVVGFGIIPGASCPCPEFLRNTPMSAFTRLSLVFILGVAIIAGCGAPKIKEGNFKVTPVSGTVTLDGAALADADVMFMLEGTPPADYPGSAGKTDAQGNFEVFSGTRKGVPAGKYKVVVSKWVGADGKTPNAAEGMDIEQMKLAGTAKQSVPPEFSDINLTKTEITVEDGKSPPPLKIGN
jgi:hypothetical protein